MRRPNARFLQAALLAASFAGASSTLPAQSSSACTGTWSAPVSWHRGDGRPVYVERSILTTLGGRDVAIGAPALFWMTREHFITEEMTKAANVDTAQIVWALTRGGAFIDANGVATALSMPDSNSGWKQPRLIGRTNSGIVVSWEGHPPATEPNRNPESNRIEVASFDGTRWSRPETVIRAGRRLDQQIGPPVRRAGAIYRDDIIVTNSVDSAYLRRRVAVRRGTEWKSFDIPKTGLFHAAGATQLGGDTIVMIEVGSNDNPPPVVKPGVTRTVPMAVWATRGTWSGDTIAWLAPVLVDTVAGSYNYPIWARLSGDSLFVLWRHDGDSLTSRGVRASVSPDGGRTWRRVPPFENASQAMLGNLAVDAAGRVHYAFQVDAMPGVLGAPGNVMHTMFTGGRWLTPAPVSTGESMVVPGVGALSGGRVMVTWTEGQFYMNGVEPKTWMRTWSSGCAR